MSGYPIQDGKLAWKYKAVASLIGGINTAQRPDQLEDSQTVQLKNVLVRQGKMTNDTGYLSFAQAVVGTPQMECQFLRQAGDTEFILITTRTIYEFDEGSGRWHLIKGTVATTSTGGPYAPGDTAITVTSGAGFSTGDLVGFSTDDGDQHQSIVTVAGAILTMTTPLVDGKTITNGNTVRRAVALAGDLDLQISACEVPSTDWFVFTNGVDIVKRYNGTDCVDVPGLPSGGNTVCRVVAYYNAALFLLNTTEGGTNFPWRALRSDQGDPTEWAAGTAGKDDLLETTAPITAARLMGPYLIVYRSNCIYRGAFIGSVDINYKFDLMVQTDGALSPNSVIEADTSHILVGQFGVYLYQGDFQLQQIGEAIFNKVFGSHGNMNPSFRTRSFCFRVEELSEIWFLYPDINSENPNTLLRYNYKTGMWYERQFANEFFGYGLFQSLSTFTWDSLVGSWDEQTWQWDSQVVLEDSYAVHLMAQVSDAAGQVYEYDYHTVLDNGSPIQYTIETKDFFIPDTDCRFDMLEMGMQGNDVEVFYSTDEGVTWTQLGTLTEPSLTKARLFAQFLFQRIRFRLTGSSSNFRLDWMGFSYKIESL